MKRSSSIDSTTFAHLQLFSQYAAASYCPNNAANNNTPTVITCPNSNNCPLLEPPPSSNQDQDSDQPNQEPITSVYEFGTISTPTDVTGFIALDPNRNLVVLSFRGSHTFKNWLANLDFYRVNSDICDNCTVWQGFWRSWTEARDGVISALQQTAADHPDYATVVVGHSLGGAIADIAAAELRKAGTPVDLYTYGAPRVGGHALTNFINGPPENGANYRVTHFDDPVPKLPPQSLGFQNVGPEYWISSGNNVEVEDGDVVMFEGENMLSGGDYGDVKVEDLFHLDIGAHLWYFGPITSCDKKKGGDLFE